MSAQQPATKPPATTSPATKPLETKPLETKPLATQQPGVPQPEGQVTATADRSRPLEGRWSVELFLDPLSIPNPPPAEKITGEVAFGSASWWTPTDRFGRYNVDTRPFFGRLYAAPANVPAFGDADTSLFTEASGGVIGDSVGIDFLPRLDHGGLSLWGRFYGDSARGKWHRRGADGGGRFLMRRVSKDAVAVAAIPIPGQPPVAVASTVKKSKKEIAAEKKVAAAQALAEKKAAAALALAEKKAAAAQALAVKKAAAAQALAEKRAADTATKAALKGGATTVATSASATNPPATNSPATSRPATTAPAAPALTTAAVTPPVTSTTTAPVTSAPPKPTTTASTSPSLTSSPTPTPTPTTATAPAPKPATTAATVPKPPASDPAATGALRVRMFDRASKKYFVSRYQLHLPDGSFKWGNFHSGLGEDGYGPVVSSRPGRYEVEVENFVCGDKFWFFASPVVRPVLVKAGEVTDVTIDLDLSSEPAKKTIDNKTGALCAAGPGTLK